MNWRSGATLVVRGVEEVREEAQRVRSSVKSLAEQRGRCSVM